MEKYNNDKIKKSFLEVWYLGWANRENWWKENMKDIIEEKFLELKNKSFQIERVH